MDINELGKETYNSIRDLIELMEYGEDEDKEIAIFWLINIYEIMKGVM